MRSATAAATTGASRRSAALERLFANLRRRDIPLPLLSQYLPDQYLEVLQGRLRRSAGPGGAPHRLVLAQYARACSRNMAAVGNAAAIC
jgi:D-tagatose-1,6-bisphosphate aldolase subunit GatZ/KbaZ